jgi:RNA polymerase sigma-70 factor (ECF subfamily)
MKAVYAIRSSAAPIDPVAAMERYAAGEVAAFDELYAALAPRLYAYLLRRTSDPELTADLLQQTLLQVHRARCRFIPGADVLPWVLAIARRLVIDSARSASRQAGRVSDTELVEMAAPTTPADDVVHAHQLAAQLARGVEQLPPPQRQALELLKGQNLSLSEAASRLHITVGALKLRLHRAHQTLRGLVAALEQAE